MPETIFAIDPGPSKSAYVVWDGETLRGSGIETNTALRSLIYLTGKERPSATFAIEMIASYGMPVGREVFETALWIGKFAEAWEHSTQTEALLVERMKVKMHHCHNARAKDSNIRQALVDQFGAPGTKKKPGRTYGVRQDIWAAFALATYVWAEEKRPPW